MAAIKAQYRLLSIILLIVALGFISYAPMLAQQYPALAIIIGIVSLGLREFVKEYGTVQSSDVIEDEKAPDE